MSNEFSVGQLVWSEQDKAEVTIAAVCDDETADCRLDRRRCCNRHLSTLKPLEPRPGDSVQVVELAPIPSDRHEPLVVGSVHQVELLLNSDSCEPSVKGFVCLHRMGKPWNERGCWCKVILLRRASTPEVKERKFYEEMPSVLPSTLPAGTKSQGGRVALTDVTLSGIVYRGRWIHEETCVEQEMLSPTCVDWSLVEIQPSPPQPETSGGWEPANGAECEGTVSQLSGSHHLRGMRIRGKYRGTSRAADGRRDLPLLEYDGETMVVDRDSLKPISPPPGGSADVPSVSGAEAVTKPSGGGSSKADPYAEHTLRMQIRGLEANGKTPLETSRVDSAIAASRRAKLEQTKKDMDRPVRHPSDFESWDEPTNVWMNGRP